ncbi:MAG: class I SAM-dependent methyltransferase [Elusimicrobiota bacterium]
MNFLEYKNIPCNLCGSNDYKILYKKVYSFEPDRIKITTDMYNSYGQIVRCKRCGLVYTTPRFPNNQIIQAYKSMDDRDYVSEQESRNINAQFSLHTIKKYKKQGTLLDIGSACGFFLNSAKKDFEVSGVELSHWATEFTRRTWGINVFEGTLEELQLKPSSVDVVSMIDTLEHLTDPQSTVAEVYKILKLNGLFYLVVPDIDGLAAKILRGYWWGLRPAHLYYFSKNSLTQLLKKNGFKIKQMKSYGRVFPYSYWLSRLHHYPKLIYKTVKYVVDAFALNEKLAYINTKDSLEIVAVR